MSVSAVASLRPIRAQCLRNATTALLSVQLRSPSATVQLRAVIALPPGSVQRRLFSHSVSLKMDDLSNTKKGAEKDDKLNQLPKRQQPVQLITFRVFAARALGAGLRSLTFAMSPTGIKTAFRQSPASTVLGLVVLLVIACVMAYTVRLYFTYFYHSQFTRYPKPIANALRRALYYTNIAPDAELALKYYRRAMDLCAEHGLDPFSDEVLGIRIQTSYWLQKIGNFKGTIQVLESVSSDCKKWIEVMEQSVRDGKVDSEGRLVKTAAEIAEAAKEAKAKAESDVATTADGVVDEEFVPENLWHKRRRLLAKAVATSVKLGELYADEHVMDPDNSQIHLVWAVESALNEFRRRKDEGVKPDEGDWLSPEALGGSMESLGNNYERKSQFHLAIPLFFQALRLCESPCHRAVIMNNLAASFAQFPIFSPNLKAPTGAALDASEPAMPATRKECLEAAENWAENAYTHAEDVKGDDRTPECDEACAVALCNWGDVAALMGKTELARKKYLQCIEMGKKLDFPDAVKQAQGGLRQLYSTQQAKN
ncbi:hypothetical protein G7046_g6357 [Stylonectria norvegica]|nr:hypothetical protein G7046_g6357 [Stylonectria norvegica]